jgi:hypothetical protein
MKEINFISGGKLGDFIHQLYVVKNMCEQQNSVANLYITDGYGGDVWEYGLHRAFNDLSVLVRTQPYIQSFEMLPGQATFISQVEFINLNDWRKYAATTHAETGKYDKCWSDLLSGVYGFLIPEEHKWLNDDKIPVLPSLEGKVIICRSPRHHTWGPDTWEKIIDQLDEEIIHIHTGVEPAIMCAPEPVDQEVFYFHDNPDSIILPVKNSHKIVNIGMDHLFTLVRAIKSCKFFIGNQSAPLAIASALDKPRIAELNPDPAPFYMGEEKYSKNISWILNDNQKHIAETCLINLVK